MRFSSLNELFKYKSTCPLCNKQLFLSFNIVNDRAYIKYRRQEEEIFMIVNTLNNDVTYTAFKRPAYRNKLTDLFREENIFLSNCKKREAHANNGKITISNYEYSLSFSINLNKKHNKVEEIQLLNEKFFIFNNEIVQEVLINYEKNETVIYFDESEHHERIVTVPINFINIDDKFSREYLIKKISAISLFE